MSDTGYGDFEFERRFWLRELPHDVLAEPDPVLIVQSYYLAVDGYAIRVRAQSSRPQGADETDIDALLAAQDDRFDFCALTAKGPMVGGTRYEAERQIDVGVGLAMIRAGGRRIVKHRYATWLGTDGWVIDVFGGVNRPLIIAECERGGPVTDLSIPDFCVTEITDDRRFANDALSHTPYGSWARDYEQELGRTGPRFGQEFGRNVIG
ncbi:MAG: hypothetical protein ACTMIR_01975 [Cellulomonadaceae bacterium]